MNEYVFEVVALQCFCEKIGPEFSRGVVAGYKKNTR